MMTTSMERIKVRQCTTCDTCGTEAAGLLVVDTWYCRTCAMASVNDGYPFYNSVKGIKTMTIVVNVADVYETTP